MTAHRCSDCGISYPGAFEFKRCPIHGIATSFFGGLDPDEDWQDQVAVLREHLATSDLQDETLPLVDGPVRVSPDGAYFVHAWDVYDVVKGRLRPSDLFQVGKQTFEVLEYIEDQREYWVRPFSLTLTDDELARLSGG